MMSVAAAFKATSRVASWAVPVALAWVLAGCGQRGPLSLPPTLAAASAPVVTHPNAPAPPPAPSPTALPPRTP